MAQVWNPATQRYEDDGRGPRGPIIVETGADDPSTVSPPIEATIEPVAPAPVPVMGSTPMGDATGAPEVPAPPEETAAPGMTAGEAMLAAPDFDKAKYDASMGVKPAAPAPAPAPPKPGMQVTGTSTTTQTSQKQMTAQETTAQGALASDAEQEAQLSGTRSDQEKKLAEKNLSTTQDYNKQVAAAQADTDRQIALQNKAISQLESHVAAKRAQLEARPIGSLMDRASNAAKLVSWLSSAAGAYVAIHSGTGRNYAQEYIDHAIDEDFKIQKARIDNDKDLLQLAKQDVQAAELKKTGMYHDLQIKKVALLDAAERKRAEDLATHGVATADISKDDKILAIRKKRDEETAELWKGLRKDVTTATTVQRAPAATVAPANPMAVTDAKGNLVGIATTSPKAAEDARAALGGYAKFNDAANELVSLMNSKGTTMTGDTAGRMKALRGELIGSARTALFPGGGTLDEGFVKLLDDMVADPASFSAKASTVSNLVAKMRASQRAVDRATQASLGAAGIRTGK